MSRSVNPLALAAAGLLVSCAGASTPCFNPSSLITDMRVIAVRNDPPETVVDLTGADPLAPIGLSALVVDETLGEYGQYGYATQITALPTKIYICLPPSVDDVNAEPGCPTGSALIADLPSVPDINSPFVYTPPLPLLQQAVAQDPVHGLGGVQLRVELDIDSSGTILIATKTLSFQLKGSLASLNHGLELVGMERSDDGQHTTYALQTPVDLTVAQSSGLRPLIGPGPGGTSAVETYLAYDNSGQLAQFTEHVTYAFYAGNALFFGQASGNIAIYTGAPGDVADEPPAGTPDPPDGLVSVEPVYPGDQGATFWVIAQDDRGAVTWTGVPYFAKELRIQCEPQNAGQGLGRCSPALYGCN